MVEIWNELPGVTPVRKFTDRNTAIRRIWRAARSLASSSTKTERIIGLLKQPSGATTEALMTITG